MAEHFDSDSDNSTALVVGDQVFYQAIFADGKPFVFNRPQMEFLLGLQKSKSLEGAAASVGKELAWAKAFLGSRKFRAFRNAKMMEMSIKNGVTIEWWYQFGKNATAGEKVWYEGACDLCHESTQMSVYEVESYRQDDMSLKAQCPVCFQALALTEKKEEFQPTREQIVAWQELGARLVPKIERVQHEFARENFVFESQEVA